MIDAKHVRFSYSWKRPLFEDLTFHVGRGRVTGLLGLNGEGKTTLLKLLAGQLLYSGGKIEVLNQDPKVRKVSFLQSVYYLSESINLPKGISVKRFFDMMKVFYPTYSQEIADECLAAFDIDPGMEMRSASQGQQKKMMLAFAFALRVAVLLLDEPTNGLDIPSKSVFRRLIAKYITEEQTVIISTHQIRDLEQIIDYAMVLRNNQILLNESLSELSERFVVAPAAGREGALYEEMSPMGKLGLYTREEWDEYNFSTEMFFNAIQESQDRILRALKSTTVNSMNI